MPACLILIRTVPHGTKLKTCIQQRKETKSSIRCMYFMVHLVVIETFKSGNGLFVCAKPSHATLSTLLLSLPAHIKSKDSWGDDCYRGMQLF